MATLELLAIVGCAVVWAKAIARWLRGQPVLPYQPRRPVPWRTFDVVLIAAMYVFSQGVILHAAYKWFAIPPKALQSAAEAPVANRDDPMSRAHPLARALAEDHNPWTVLLCVISGVVVAPITEELVFRLVLQGWLESLERRMRRRIPFLRQFLAGFVPVTMVAILFAAMHGRSAETTLRLPVVVLLLAVHAIAGVLTVVASVCWLKFVARATLVDLGIVPGKIVRDLRTGAIAFLAVTMPVLIINVNVNIFLPQSVVADPIPIFFLAMALGILYYRTHRIIPSIALHMAFNAVGVFTAIASAK